MTHHFAFGYSRKGYHRRIVFSFVKSSVCLTVLFFNNQEIFTVVLSKLSWSAFRGGDKILVFHTRSRVVSAMERVCSKNLYTNSFTRNELRNFRLMFLKTLALIYGFLLYK